jgi:hypothetical protein
VRTGSKLTQRNPSLGSLPTDWERALARELTLDRTEEYDLCGPESPVALLPVLLQPCLVYFHLGRAPHIKELASGASTYLH